MCSLIHELRLDNCAEYCECYWVLINAVKNIQFPKRENFLDYLRDYLLFIRISAASSYLVVIRTL
jgi:hypothetical protein